MRTNWVFVCICNSNVTGGGIKERINIEEAESCIIRQREFNASKVICVILKLNRVDYGDLIWFFGGFFGD